MILNIFFYLKEKLFININLQIIINFEYVSKYFLEKIKLYRIRL